MGQTATPQPTEPIPGQTGAQSAAQTQAAPARPPLLLPGAVDPMTAGIGLATAGFLGFVTCRLVLSRHWNKIKSDPDAHPLGAIWTDVLVRLISYVCVFMLGIGLLLIGARLAGRI